MWSIATALSWQAEQAEAMGGFTRGVPWAWHGAETLQVATTPAQGCAVVQTHGASAAQVVVTVPIFCVNVTATLLTEYGPLTLTLQGFAAVHTQGEPGVQLDAPWVPLKPS